MPLILISRQGAIYGINPGDDAPAQAPGVDKTLFTQVFYRIRTAATYFTINDDPLISWQLIHSRRELTHWNQFTALDLTYARFACTSHVDKQVGHALCAHLLQFVSCLGRVAFGSV